MRRLALLPLIGLLGAASDVTFSTDWPPARFQRDTIVTVAFLTPDGVQTACGTGGLPGVVNMRACSSGPTGRRLVVVPRPGTVSHEEFARLVSHELAHANKWTRMHER